MQTTTFIKTIKWLYSLEIDEALDYFRGGFQQYIDGGRSCVAAGIEDAYMRGIHLNTQARDIEQHADAPQVLDAFGLSAIYDADWWQTVVGTFLRLLATSEENDSQIESMQETVADLEHFVERMQVLLSCVGPLQQLIVPAAVMRQSDFDETLTLEIYANTGTSSPSVERINGVLSVSSELYSTMARIHANEQPAPLHAIHMSSEDGFRFDFSGEPEIPASVTPLRAGQG